jgi:hypothetical protein
MMTESVLSNQSAKVCYVHSAIIISITVLCVVVMNVALCILTLVGACAWFMDMITINLKHANCARIMATVLEERQVVKW